MMLAYSLFKRAVPILVDRIAAEPEALTEAVRAVAGVRKVRRVRSRWAGSEPVVDVIIAVDAHLSTAAAHAVADTIETVLRQQFAIADVTVHIEPDVGR
jgi:divalent metal cation (Fe/Co/Zn/Cd) transporter